MLINTNWIELKSTELRSFIFVNNLGYWYVQVPNILDFSGYVYGLELSAYFYKRYGTWNSTQ